MCEAVEGWAQEGVCAVPGEEEGGRGGRCGGGNGNKTKKGEEKKGEPPVNEIAKWVLHSLYI